MVDVNNIVLHNIVISIGLHSLKCDKGLFLDYEWVYSVKQAENAYLAPLE